MRNALGLAFAAFVFAFGLFLCYLIPFNSAANDGLARTVAHAHGVVGFLCGVEYLLCGLLIGLITTRQQGSYCRGEDLILSTAFGVVAIPTLLADGFRQRREQRARLARRLASVGA